MRRASITVIATLAMLACAAPAQALTATTRSAGNITDTSATMRGEVDPGLVSVSPSYYFEYGSTQAYGSKTPATVFALATTAKARLVGLSPNTAYHYRVVATGLLDTARGADVAFTTLKAGDGSSSGSGSGDSGSGSGSSSGSGSGSGDSGSGSTSGSGSGSGQDADAHGGDGDSSGAGSGDSGSDQIPVVVEPGDSDRPVLGSTIGAAPETGSIEVRTPGAPDFAPLPDGAPLPVGSTVDARHGSVKVVTAVGNAGAVQTATFHGAVFQVRQSRKADGLTDIYLRGGDFSACEAHRQMPAGAHLKKKKRRAVRRLWGHDHHGRFRTHGRGAIATVRGTTWIVADHCAGTRTSVLSGAVSVRDKRRHKTVLVHAGHSYFARTQR